MTATLYAGMMSGTSLDGIDAVLAEFGGTGAATLHGHVHEPLEPVLRAELLALNRVGADELGRAALAANSLARAYARLLARLLDEGGVTPSQVRAVGAHGQTVRHRPHEPDGVGYTVQLLNGALLAELGGIDVVCDFRSRDLAAGGEGAPLVPGFHAARFASPTTARAVLNLGGIANLTLLPVGGPVRGFDCGPGNVLLDLVCRRATGEPYDRDGRLAARGAVDAALLARWLADPYFSRPAPKSTGRELFDAGWLDASLADRADDPATLLATLAELTAQAAADALLREAPATRELYVCGGGAFNGHLMRRLAARLPALRVACTATLGVAPDQVEALAFAWLASAFVEGRPGNEPAATGARGPRRLGALYPAS